MKHSLKDNHKTLRSKADYVLRRKSYDMIAFKDVQTVYYFWLLRSMYSASQKNTRLLFHVGIVFEKYGLSNAGMDFLSSLGVFMSSKTFRNRLKKELNSYNDYIRSVVFLYGVFLWIDNFAKFLKHFLPKVDIGSATSNQMTAIAAKRLPINCKLESIEFEGYSWPKSPISESAAKSVSQKILTFHSELVESLFNIRNHEIINRELQVPLKNVHPSPPLPLFFSYV